MNTRIITHRGLDPDRAGYFAESSAEAFTDQLARGFGLEFDIQFSSDGVMIAVHDATLSRITGGKDTRKVSEVDSKEILAMRFDGCRLATVREVLDMIRDFQVAGELSALHLKHLWQDEAHMDLLLKEIRDSGISPANFIIFDAKPEAARYIKGKMPELSLSASVSHPYDIERYNSAVGGTLISLYDIVNMSDVFSWAWLDEWDLAAPNGGKKKLLTKETFKALRKSGISIALVTPELHAKSPGLLGGEAHEDGVDSIRLIARFEEIAVLKPDAVCTDHPDIWRSLVD